MMAAGSGCYHHFVALPKARAGGCSGILLELTHRRGCADRAPAQVLRDGRPQVLAADKVVGQMTTLRQGSPKAGRKRRWIQCRRCPETAAEMQENRLPEAAPGHLLRRHPRMDLPVAVGIQEPVPVAVGMESRTVAVHPRLQQARALGKTAASR